MRILLIPLEQQIGNLKKCKKYKTEKSDDVCIKMKHLNAEKN